MKPIHIILAVICGTVAGATVGLLFAPEKGSDTRAKIAKMLKDKGINLNGKKLDELVENITNEIKGE